MRNLQLKQLLKKSQHLLGHAFVAVLLTTSVCTYTPQTIAAETSTSALSMLTGVNSQNGDNTEDFLQPDAAFKLQLKTIDAQNIEASFQVAPGYYLYRQRIKFEALSPDTGHVRAVTLPSGDIKTDPNFGQQEVYHHDFKANIQLAANNNPQVTLTATYQGCSEKGLCYAPIKKTYTLTLKTTDNGASSQTTATSKEQSASSALKAGDTANDDSTTLLRTGNLWLIIAGFFGAGLLLSLTPCVLPMIPILSSIIVGTQGISVHGKLHNFGLSVAYVLGMSLSYTIAGIAAGLSGNLLSQSLQSPWVLGASALVFVLLSLSMFGIYELKLPSALEDKLVNTSNRLKGGKFLGVFIMGILSALIVSPCVAAPLAGALIYISQSQDYVLGGTALFALSLGMGVPLLLIGAAGSHVLPKVGNWMNSVRNFFGVLMLAMAIWLISPVIATGIQLALWASLLIVTAVYLNALDTLPHQAKHADKLWKGIAVIMLVFGIALLIGALSGAKSAFQPLAKLGGNVSVAQSASLVFKRVSSVEALDSAIVAAQGKPVMLDFYADWCVACKELEETTFSDPKVQQTLQNTTLLQVDVTANTDADKALLKRYNLFGPPGIVFFNAHGQEMASLKTVGYQDANDFSRTLAKRDSCMIAPKNNRNTTTLC